MKLSRKSLIIRWAYLFNSKSDIPDRTSVCPLFWRVALGTPSVIALICTLIVLVLSGIFIVVQGTIRYWRLTLLLLGLGLLIGMVVHAIRSRQRVKCQQPSVVREYAKAIKNKVCPIVEITD